MVDTPNASDAAAVTSGDISASPPVAADIAPASAAAAPQEAQSTPPVADAQPPVADTPAPQEAAPAADTSREHAAEKIKTLLAQQRIPASAPDQTDRAVEVERVDVQEELPRSESSRELPPRLYFNFHTPLGAYDLHAFRQAILATFEGVPGLRDKIDFETARKKRETPAEDMEQFKTTLTRVLDDAIAKAEPPETKTMLENAKATALSWNRFTARDKNEWPSPSVQVQANGSVMASLRVQPNVPGLAEDATSPTNFVHENITKRVDAIRASLVYEAKELQKQHAATHPDQPPLFTDAEIEAIGQMKISHDAGVRDNGKGTVEFYFGAPHDDVEGKPWESVGESPLKKLDSDKLHEVLLNALLSAGQDAQKIFPVIAGPKEMKARLAGLGIADERMTALLNDDLLKTDDQLEEAEKNAETALKGKIQVYKDRDKPVCACIELDSDMKIDDIIAAINAHPLEANAPETPSAEAQPAAPATAEAPVADAAAQPAGIPVPFKATPIKPDPIGSMIGGQAPAKPDPTDAAIGGQLVTPSQPAVQPRM